MTADTKTKNEDFVVTRLIDAPRETVWRAWSEKESLAQWWGPKGFGVDVKTLTFKPGGMFHYSMTLPDGKMWWGKFVYGAIEAPHRLEFVNSFSDENAGVVRAPFSADFPLRISNVVTFEDEGGKTRLTLRGHPVDATDAERAFYAGMHQSMQQGFKGTLDQLDQYLKNI